jgi:hypothetical protein
MFMNPCTANSAGISKPILTIMKLKSVYILLSVFALSATLSLTSCKKDDDPSATEKKLNLLTANGWSLTRVTVDGVDKTSLFEGLTLNWNEDNTFTVQNGGVIWPGSGTWSFTDGTGQVLFVSLTSLEDAEVTIETLNETTLIISLHWDETTIGHGRTKSVEGDHIFEFEAAN